MGKQPGTVQRLAMISEFQKVFGIFSVTSDLLSLSFSFTYSSDGQEIENLGAVLPGVGITILLLALVIESVYLRNLSRLVVSTQKSDLVRPASLESKEIGEGLQRVVSAVDEIAHENVVRAGQGTSSLEQLAQIVELSVNISTNSDRRGNGLHVGFLQEQLLNLNTINPSE